ncbi:Hypothetical protein I595_1144 [Croceitalea dokdonensis DOKDO 023]|uniref:Uncharacterized protein n=1 Tax=Croceitalea dokdonensis DOKDO 023 TaxID=1300341 RepID=A0A0P7AGW0_9FLAO|nr:Hypothetical protein I595_1144 [Croceitalea dokdonensis DOKDO 023]
MEVGNIGDAQKVFHWIFLDRGLKTVTKEQEGSDANFL